jgi:hypothetical protein
MRRTILSSVCLVVVAAGIFGYHLSRLEPAPQHAIAAPVREAQPRPVPGAPAVSTLAPAYDDGLDRTSQASGERSGEHFPDTPVGRALDQHLQILVDINPGADDRKARSLAELRTHAREASRDLLAAYHDANPADTFGRWLTSLTLAELHSNDAYPGLKEIADSPIPIDLKDNDREGTAAANESAIRQNAAGGLVALARDGNAAAEADLLRLALDPQGDYAVRTLAIKGYLAAGSDHDARVRALKAQLPARYQDVVTLTVSDPEPAFPPAPRPTHTTTGG